MDCIENIGLFKHYDRIDSGKNMSTLSRVYKVIGIQCHGVQGVLVGRWHWLKGHHHGEPWRHLWKCDGQRGAGYMLRPSVVFVPWYVHCPEGGPVAESSTNTLH